MNDKILDLMMDFGRNHPEGFSSKQVIDFLVSKGILRKDAESEMDLQAESMEILDD